MFGLELAAWIHGRGVTSQHIVEMAACGLGVASAKQSKRLFADSQHPTRIYLKDMHLLQYLVFVQSESEERKEEDSAPDAISERDGIIRYLAFIIKYILKTNSLYGVTGVCRFIRRYELKEVRGIHEALLDESEVYTADGVFCSHRSNLRDKILRRFPRYLRENEARNGQEKHFRLREDQSDPSLVRLVKDSLDTFKPWRTNCLPADFAAHEEGQGEFKHPDWSVCEMRRLHTLVHPPCFEALSKHLGINDPDARLGIPQFFSVKPMDNLPPDGGHGNPRAANAGESTPEAHGPDGRPQLEALRVALARHAEKLERFVPRGVLTVKLGGEDVASIDLDVANRVRFTIDDEEAELIEIFSEREQTLLAAHLVDEAAWLSPRRQSPYVVRHRSGAQVTFRLARRVNADTGGNELLVEVTYRERRLDRALVFLWRRVKNRVVNWIKGEGGKSRLNLRALPLNLSAVQLLVIALLVGASVVWFYPSSLLSSGEWSAPKRVSTDAAAGVNNITALQEPSSSRNSSAPAGSRTADAAGPKALVPNGTGGAIKARPKAGRKAARRETTASHLIKKSRGRPDGLRATEGRESAKGQENETGYRDNFSSYEPDVTAFTPGYLFERNIRRSPHQP